jgi:transcriptional regulator with XRE-family HTH domain
MAEDGAAALSSEIGLAIRTQRLAGAISLADLARRSGLSQPHLSQLENGHSTPSISALYRIADALGVGAEKLLPRRDETRVLVTRSGQGLVVPGTDLPGSSTSRLLAGGPGIALEAHEIRSSAMTTAEPWLQHDGEDFLYVIEGSVTVEVGDDTPVQLRAGDAIWYRARQRHRWTATTRAPFRVLLVNSRGGQRSS